MQSLIIWELMFDFTPRDEVEFELIESFVKLFREI